MLAWNFRTSHVEINSNRPTGQTYALNEDFAGIDFARGSSTVLFVGPRRFPLTPIQVIENGRLIETALTESDIGTSPTSPVIGGAGGGGGGSGARSKIRVLGGVQSLDATTQQQITEVFELGSWRRYILPGVTYNRFSAARLVMANSFAQGYSNANPAFSEAAGGSLPGGNERFFLSNARNLLAKLYQLQTTPSDVGDPFGFDLSGISSKIPIGVGIALLTPDSRAIGGIYCEDTYVETSAFRTTAQGDVVADTVNCRFDHAYPMTPRHISWLLDIEYPPRFSPARELNYLYTDTVATAKKSSQPNYFYNR